MLAVAVTPAHAGGPLKIIILSTAIVLYQGFAFAGPRLFFETAPVFDQECVARTGAKVDPSWYAELLRRLPEFQKAWDDRAPLLNSLAEEIAGRRYSRAEYSVALPLCPWTPMGTPLIVTVRPYLDLPARQSGKVLLSMAQFVSMTHHELLHSLVNNIETEEFSNTSAMLEKYSREPYNVLVHLHLIALQWTVYERTGDQEMLSATTKLYELIGGDYARAMEIVKSEGAAPFNAELVKYNSKN